MMMAMKRLFSVVKINANEAAGEASEANEAIQASRDEASQASK